MSREGDKSGSRVGFNHSGKLGAVFSIHGNGYWPMEKLKLFLRLVVGLLDLKWEQFGFGLSKE